jgi:hypothetical protein
MKTNYFTKIEDKYVFNISLIFWHVFIALSTVAIVLSVIVFLWSVIPPQERKVIKQSYPEKQQIPAPVAVMINELSFEEAGKVEAPPVQEINHAEVAKRKEIEYEDNQGEEEYNASINALKKLIPPSKYSWAGSGYWTYPYGERYWEVYKQERYRQWNIKEASVEDKLEKSYRVSKATTYINKKQLLDAYTTVVKLFPEEKRLGALQYLMDNVSNNVSQNINVCQSVSKVIDKMDNEKSISYMNQILIFGKKNPNDGSPFIDYISTILDKFDIQKRAKTIDLLINSYYNYFNQNFEKQKEATDLFIPMLAEIKGEYHPKALMQYYGLYIDKNYEREKLITKIDNEYQQKIERINNQFMKDQALAAAELEERKIVKAGFRYKSILGLGGGILLIVLIGTLLVFLSIQRSVRKIEEKLSSVNNL